MRSSMYIHCLFLVFSIAVDYILAAELGPPLYIIAPGKEDVGGCDDHLDVLRKGYTEAIKIAFRAIEALEFIRNPLPDDDEDELSASNPSYVQGRKEWSRQARLAKAMFAIDTSPDTGVAAGESTFRLNYAIDSFRAVTRDVDISPIPDHYKRRVYCSPKGIAHFPVGSKDPRDKTVDKDKYPDGMFGLAPIPPEDKEWVLWKALPHDRPDPKEDWCPDPSAAQTAHKQQFVIWCPPAWKLPATLGTIQWTDEMPHTVSITWLHELMHLWTWTMENRNDEIMPDQTVAREDNGFAYHVPKTLCYGFPECVELSKIFPEKSVNNADNYANFAFGVYLDKWDWVTPMDVGRAARF